MNKIFPYLALIIFASCNENKPPAAAKASPKQTVPVPAADSLRDSVNYTPDSVPELETITCYVVIADTGTSYYQLREQMFALHNTLKQTIDTMERNYNTAKDLIALPDNHPDEIYAGDYFPRRYPTNVLSLEYLNVYKQYASEKSIALVTGIYTDKNGADSALTILKKQSSAAFVIKSDIYMGCMH